MIARLKRQTKRRHSVQRDWACIRSRAEARRLAEQIIQDLSFPPIGEVVRAKYTPDIWAPR